MAQKIKTELCIVGGGAGGLSVAAVAAQLGMDVTLVEAHEQPGGDCLHHGCVPSKALLAAAKTAHAMRTAAPFGISPHRPSVDYAKVREHIRGVQACIAKHDSVERFEKLGVRVIQAQARFKDRDRLQAGTYDIHAKHFVIATGSSPSIPPIDGLDTVPYLTNHTIFDLDKPPQRLLVLGGGPIGTELAQAHARLGTPVTQLTLGEILPNDERACVEPVRAALKQDGIDLREQLERVIKILRRQDEIVIHYEKQDRPYTVSGSHLLLATGRKANVEDLALEAAGVEYTPHGITVDRRLRSTNKRIYVIGDAAGPYQFTHMAAYQAGIVIRNILFKWPTKVDYRAITWVTYTEPEIAHVGMQEPAVRLRSTPYRVIKMSFEENDRAQTERTVAGYIQVIVNRHGIVVGCTLVGAHAGELILPWCLCVQQRRHIKEMATVIAPYPTLSEIGKRVAAEYYRPMLSNRKIRFLVKWLQRLF